MSSLHVQFQFSFQRWQKSGADIALGGCNQGCQMVPKIPIWVHFVRAWEWKMLAYFMGISNNFVILWSFGTFFHVLVY
jgi:hypothetical protein